LTKIRKREIKRVGGTKVDKREFAFIAILILVAVLTFGFTISLLVWPERTIGTISILGKLT